MFPDMSVKECPFGNSRYWFRNVKNLQYTLLGPKPSYSVVQAHFATEIYGIVCTETVGTSLSI